MVGNNHPISAFALCGHCILSTHDPLNHKWLLPQLPKTPYIVPGKIRVSLRPRKFGKRLVADIIPLKGRQILQSRPMLAQPYGFEPSRMQQSVQYDRGAHADFMRETMPQIPLSFATHQRVDSDYKNTVARSRRPFDQCIGKCFFAPWVQLKPKWPIIFLRDFFHSRV